MSRLFPPQDYTYGGATFHTVKNILLKSHCGLAWWCLSIILVRREIEIGEPVRVPDQLGLQSLKQHNSPQIKQKQKPIIGPAVLAPG